jgi:hypothetical protein
VSGVLKPCPFCGGETKLRDYGEIPGYDFRYGTVVGHDSDCPLSAWDGYLYETEAQAIAAWNTRPEDRTASTDELVAGLERARGVLRDYITASGEMDDADRALLADLDTLLNKHREAKS